MENIKIILRCIAAGEKTIFEDKHGNYVSKRAESFISLEDCVEKDIESRLKYELYGEYPLSEINENDYLQNIRPSLNFK